MRLTKEYPVYPISRLSDMLQTQVIDEIIFAVDSRRLGELEDSFLLCDEEGVRSHVAVDFFPHVNSDVYLDWLGPAPLLTFAAAPDDEIRLMIKRVRTLFLRERAPYHDALHGAARSSHPPYVSGSGHLPAGPCGLNGRRFVCFKFRSMCADAEKMKVGSATPEF